uniref:Uncharacterized protein n=1 Tax=Denticeps clupeoides TaxID=299321 RepID=A0AAY4EJJ2_9TELE
MLGKICRGHILLVALCAVLARSQHLGFLFVLPPPLLFISGLSSRKDEGEVCNSKPEREKDKGHFWDSVTMTMRQITPIRKMDKMEGWEPPRLCDATGEGEVGKLAGIRRRGHGSLSEASWEGLK